MLLKHADWAAAVITPTMVAVILGGALSCLVTGD
jgi:hypothetical protein